MPQDDIMDWVNNESDMYNDLHRMFDTWMEQGEGWDKKDAIKEASALAAHMAEAIESFDFVDDKYTPAEVRAAAEQMLEDFEQYREEEIAEVVKTASTKATPEVMDEGAIEYAKKQEEMIVAVGISTLPNIVDHPVNVSKEEAKKAGIEYIRGYMPVSAAKVRYALEHGDRHLNTIKMRLWDEAATKMGYRHIRGPRLRGLSLSDATGVLKHVAKWYYA